MIYCANCGTGLQDDAAFCPECGSKINKPEQPAPAQPPTPSEVTQVVQQQTPVQEPAPIYTPPPQPAAPAAPGQFQSFLKVSLPDFIRKVIFDPMEGTKKIISEVKDPLRIGIFCTLISAFVICLFFYLRLPSEIRHEMDFFEYFIRALFIPLIGSFLITFFSFIIKAINNSQKANFGDEFLTGGIVTLGYALFFVVSFLLSYVLEGSLDGSRRVSYGDFGYRVHTGPSTFSIIILFSVFIYLFVITSNSFSQSLRSSKVKDGPAFYLSPFIIVITAYFTIRIWIALFGHKLGIDEFPNPFAGGFD